MASDDPSVALAREAAQRTRAAAAAIVAAIALIAGSLVMGLTLKDVPQVTSIEALRDAAGQPPATGGLRTEAALYLHDHALGLTLGQLLQALGGLLAAGALVYLFQAVRARKPEISQGAMVALAIGGVAYFVGTLVRQIARDVSLASFAGAADHGTQAAHDATQPAFFVVGTLFQYVGQLALAIGFIIVALNAMRVGLLTRFMGVLGIFAGLLFILQVTTLPVIQAFWFASFGAMILGRWPGPIPPAWASGRAEPWPTRQEQLEARAGEGG